MTSAAQWFEYPAWLIDLDGTLYHAAPVRLAMAAELLLLGPHRIRAVQQFRRAHEALRQEQHSIASGQQPSEAASPYARQLQRAAAELRLSEGELAPVIHEWMERRPGKWLWLFRRRSLLAAIVSYRAQGGKTALVSDYPAQAKLQAIQAASLFDAVVACGEASGPSHLKPHPEGYLLAAQRLGIPPQKCLVIGDRDDADGEAARRAGMGFRLS